MNTITNSLLAGVPATASAFPESPNVEQAINGLSFPLVDDIIFDYTAEWYSVPFGTSNISLNQTYEVGFTVESMTVYNLVTPRLVAASIADGVNGTQKYLQVFNYDTNDASVLNKWTVGVIGTGAHRIIIDAPAVPTVFKSAFKFTAENVATFYIYQDDVLIHTFTDIDFLSNTWTPSFYLIESRSDNAPPIGNEILSHFFATGDFETPAVLPPTLSAPGNGNSVVYWNASTMTFYWNAVATVVTYKFQLSFTEDFTEIFTDVDVDDTQVTLDVPVLAGSLYNGQKIWWRAASLDPNTEEFTVFSDPFYFIATSLFTNSSSNRISFTCANILVINIEGSIGDGYLTIKGASTPQMDGEVLGKIINVADGSVISSGNITSAGIYEINVAGLTLVTLNPSNDFEGSISLAYSVTEKFNRVNA